MRGHKLSTRRAAPRLLAAAHIIFNIFPKRGMNMDWMNQLSGLLEQYNGAQPSQAPDTVHDDFDQLAQTAPQSALAEGLAAAFRSDQTPAFGQMVAQLFANAGGQQRASILNTLISALGPTLLSQLLSRGGVGGGLSDLLRGGQREVTPDQAEQISPDAVAQIAEQAEQKDPSIIDRVSDFYSAHPTLVKSLGAAALTIALAQIAQRQNQ
ncbi:MAG TPA: hypothetical protein VF708_18695 [Pyrinomonadaceae bacterium]